MFLDSLSDFGLLSRMGRVISAHDPLQFRKFINHQCHQVSFAQLCGSQCLRFLIRAGVIGQNAGKITNPFHFFMQGSQFFLENDSLQWLDKVSQIFLFVLIIEKPGIFQSGTQNPLVAIFDFRSRRHIADRNEAGQ